MQNENELFDGKHLGRTYLKLALPLILSMVVTLVYNLADTFFVARTGNTDLVAGVSLCAPVFTFLMAIGNIYGQGGSSLLSRLLGQEKYEQIKNVSAFCFYIAFLSGVVIGAVMLLIRQPMMGLLGANEATRPHASDYYFWLVLGSPFVILSFIHSNLLRSEGRSRESMIGTITGALLLLI